MPYYIVAYGHVLRCEKAEHPSSAARLAFGVTNGCTVRQLPKKPTAMSQKLLRVEQEELAKRHFHRFGNTVSGFEKLPGIYNVHWTKCPLCHFPITTEPKAEGIDDRICGECEPKFATLSTEEQEALSIAATRAKLGIQNRGHR